MNSNHTIEAIAREYIDSRFPRASQAERDKYVRDWTHKIEVCRSIVVDFKKRAGDPLGMKILDAGSGNGGLSIAFAEAGAVVSGVEIEGELVEIAKRQATAYGVDPAFVLYPGDILPFPDATFDRAISVSVLEHTSDPRQYLGEIFRTLKPGGRLYLAFPNRLWPKETHTGLWGLTYIPVSWMPPVLKFFRRNPLEDNNLHFYTYWNMTSMLRSIESAGEGRFRILQESGKVAHGIKGFVKKMLSSLRLSHRAFLPHVMVILEKER